MGMYPRLMIDLKKIEHNTRIISNLASKQNIQITGVTKCCCGALRVAEAMLKGGAISIADSRIENLKQLKESGIKTELMLLRTPMLSESKEVVKYSDISLNSDITVLKQLSNVAKKIGNVHKVIIMVEMGDLREGVPQEQLDPVLVKASKLKGLEIYGLGMNLACYGGIVPTEEKLIEFSEFVDKMEQKLEFPLKLISGGNSANIPLLLNSQKITKVNNLRIGEGILLGLETVNRTPIPNTYQDAFILEAEIIELNEKPSIPDGEISQNAFGETPVFEDKGIIKRGILAVGRQDVIIEGLKPFDDKISILGSSSDHIIFQTKLDSIKVGDIIKFHMDYGGLLHLCTSQYVKKEFVYKK
jgi:predicted amino acid racemase